jgi:pimeloyl-ACP methyl ester carboxylesterase
MAQDLVELMTRLGHQRFHAVGHDRGGYVVQRLALDHPRSVDRIVILGDVPIDEALARCDARFAQSWWHWYAENSIGGGRLCSHRGSCRLPLCWVGRLLVWVE